MVLQHLQDRLRSDIEGSVFLKRKWFSRKSLCHVRIFDNVLSVHANDTSSVQWNICLLDCAVSSVRTKSFTIRPKIGPRVYIALTGDCVDCSQWVQILQDASGRQVQADNAFGKNVGEGASASVHEAEDIKTGATVAVKTSTKPHFHTPVAKTCACVPFLQLACTFGPDRKPAGKFNFNFNSKTKTNRHLNFSTGNGMARRLYLIIQAIVILQVECNILIQQAFDAAFRDHGPPPSAGHHYSDYCESTSKSPWEASLQTAQAAPPTTDLVSLAQTATESSCDEPPVCRSESGSDVVFLSLPAGSEIPRQLTTSEIPSLSVHNKEYMRPGKAFQQSFLHGSQQKTKETAHEGVRTATEILRKLPPTASKHPFENRCDSSAVSSCKSSGIFVDLTPGSLLPPRVTSQLPTLILQDKGDRYTSKACQPPFHEETDPNASQQLSLRQFLSAKLSGLRARSHRTTRNLRDTGPWIKSRRTAAPASAF